VVRPKVRLRHLLYFIGCVGGAIGLLFSLSGALSIRHNGDIELFYKRGAATLDSRGEHQKAAEWRREGDVHRRLKHEGIQHGATVAALAVFVLAVFVIRVVILRRLASSPGGKPTNALIATNRICIELLIIVVISLTGALFMYCALLAIVAIGMD
jgi:hypothetical protein